MNIILKISVHALLKMHVCLPIYSFTVIFPLFFKNTEFFIFSNKLGKEKTTHLLQEKIQDRFLAVDEL